MVLAPPDARFSAGSQNLAKGGDMASLLPASSSALFEMRVRESESLPVLTAPDASKPDCTDFGSLALWGKRLIPAFGNPNPSRREVQPLRPPLAMPWTWPFSLRIAERKNVCVQTHSKASLNGWPEH
jgi:hypothetical protein